VRETLIKIDLKEAVSRLLALQEDDFPVFLEAVDNFNAQAVEPLSEKLGSELHAKVLLLKLSNIAVGRYEFRRRHTRLVAHPFGLVVDPANDCPLSCPGCLHADNAKKDIMDWAPGKLNRDIMEELLNRYGPYAITTRFFNWGEPLLNKRTPEYVAMAREFFHRTSISSNLSVHFDAEALVASGLDYLIMSIDGATQKTYERYRRRGNLELVLDNIERLVVAKQKLQSKTPYLQWQYLLFNHTIPEMDKAMKLAQKIGINEINFTNPYDVSANDPSITLPAEMPIARHIFTGPGPGVTQSSRNAAKGLSNVIREHFQWRWLDRLEGVQISSAYKTCQWLYKNMVMDANGAILPCCFLHKKNSTAYFSSIYNKDIFNSDSYLEARSYFSSGKSSSHLCCHGCTAVNSLPNVNNSQIPFFFSYIDLEGTIDMDAVKRLADW
jgi:MoaA/NifB/PqqE/SkfB family radical SAM enzyme